MITFVIKMLELPKFVHMTTLQYNLSQVIKFHGGVVMDRNYDVITFIIKEPLF